jgi:NTP pyrophosphatase (non-canonical NTP hydrolase)
MEIKELIKEAHENAENHGFWDDWNRLRMCCKERREIYKNYAIGNMLMLIVSELGEALEGLRHGDMDNFREELADVAIRLADLCGGLEIDLEAEILKKMEVNRNRPYKHGKGF